MIRRLFFEWRYLRRQAPWDTGQSPPELLAALARLSPGKALDLGCGTGTNLRTMAKAGWQVTGVDFSSQAIDRARRKLRSFGPQVHLIHGDVSRLPEL
jgi:ubiquinone/menaquinone biosynthesis C-methylase UbiE